jgi:hypothetical protein
VHRDDVRNAGTPGRPRAVHGHREFVAVRHLNPMPPESLLQGARTGSRQALVLTEVLDRDAGSFELPRQPPFTVGVNEHDVARPGRLQHRRHVSHDLLGAARPVRFDQVRNAHA